jgi:hypothetical protein
MYGNEVIDHPYNLVSTCSTRCNASVDIGYKSEIVKELVEKIVKDIKKNKNKLDKL